jgi:hypothetical protein
VVSLCDVGARGLIWSCSSGIFRYASVVGALKLGFREVFSIQCTDPVRKGFEMLQSKVCVCVCVCVLCVELSRAQHQSLEQCVLTHSSFRHTLCVAHSYRVLLALQCWKVRN